MPAEEEAQAIERRNVRCFERQALLDSYLEVYDGLCSLKKVDLIGQVCTGISVQRTLVREAKIHDAVAVVVGISKQSALGGWTSTAGYCAKRLPPTTDVLAIHNGKILFGRCNHNQLTGLSGDPRPSLNLLESPLPDEVRSEFGDSEVDTVTSSIEVLTRCGSEDSKDEVPSLPHELKKRPTAHYTGDILDQRPGWPLLRRASSASPENLQARELSVVQWAMSLPIRWPHKNPLGSRIDRSPEGQTSDFLEESNRISSYGSGEVHYSLEILLKTKFSGCKWFNHEVLKTATSNFYSGNLIGKGECNRVYKGILPDGKRVAVKIRRNNAELSDFGLAIWGPTTSSFITQCDVVGTFGYLAPEYFMYGKVSDKIDVYAFGVILLELLSGRRPIGYETSKDQESLVMWAKPIIDCGNARDIIDPNLDEYFDEPQMQRMVLAAKLCITRSARLRPKMIHVLKLLRGDKDAVKWANIQNEYLKDIENQEENDDEVYPNSSAELHLNLALLDLDDDSISSSSFEQGNNNLSMEEYLKERWSRSSRFN
ncbi:hypothetical protein GH714_032276 [Hevea brasiliensis]|uniref:Protein kinase domain-containing protein n=1 Tax=Hevea brasiliensis TaxID=3981 RepID=A0A6A6LP86_HEVBR|nr:hypothetical protein GH714_032276 [Hevea brasiliensis]